MSGKMSQDHPKPEFLSEEDLNRRFERAKDKDLAFLANSEELMQALCDMGNSSSYAVEVLRSMENAHANHRAFLKRQKILRQLVTILIVFGVTIVILSILAILFGLWSTIGA